MAESSSIFTGNDPLDPSRLSLDNGIYRGDFFIGPPIHTVDPATVRNIMEYLAKRDDTDEFMTLKVLTISTDNESIDDRQGKVLLHNERLILSLLNDQPGVIHHHGLFRDRSHFILVLDCLVAHDYDSDGRYKHYINLQQYVIQKKKLHEKEALEMFFSILTTVRMLHSNNIVHRDLKLRNMVLNLKTGKVTLTNFGLSKHLVRGGDLLTDQRGSPAYVSPDVLSGNAYDGKASDMWAMGVLLYTMLYGHFPFYHEDPQELFKKIRSADFGIPDEGHKKMQETSLLIRRLIERDTERRLDAAQTLDLVQRRLSQLSTTIILEPSPQVVPDSMDPIKMDDCIVPEQQDESSISSSLSEMTISSNLQNNSVQPALAPILPARFDADHMINNNQLFSVGAGDIAGVHLLSPVITPPVTAGINSPTTLQYSIGDFVPAQVHQPRSGNPFIAHYSSGAAARINPPIIPQHTHTQNPSPTSSLLSSYQEDVVYRRYPLALSLSSDSYFSSSSPAGSSGCAPTLSSNFSLTVPQSSFQSPSRNFRRMPIGAAQHSQGRTTITDNDHVDSLVTVRMSRHSLAGASVTISTARSGRVHGRHSFSEGDRPNPHLLIPPQTRSQAQRRRRNSSGCEHSVHHSPTSVGNRSGSSSDLRRRRRSHDSRADQSDMPTYSLIDVTSRRRRSHSSPFQVPVQIQYTPPMSHVPTTTH